MFLLDAMENARLARSLVSHQYVSCPGSHFQALLPGYRSSPLLVCNFGKSLASGSSYAVSQQYPQGSEDTGPLEIFQASFMDMHARLAISKDVSYL